jgi:RHS repeat-associated protein
LGSALVITDKGGNILQSDGAQAEFRTFDAFGKARDNLGEDSLNGNLFATNPNGKRNRKGFTGHQHLDEVGLIHMNGRAYDYNLGRFYGVDPIIQFPTNSQSLNGYSYLMNNPLSGTDSTGYKKDQSDHVNPFRSGSICASKSINCDSVSGSALSRLVGNIQQAKSEGNDVEYRDGSTTIMISSNGANTGLGFLPENRLSNSGNPSSLGGASDRGNEGFSFQSAKITDRQIIFQSQRVNSAGVPYSMDPSDELSELMKQHPEIEEQMSLLVDLSDDWVNTEYAFVAYRLKGFTDLTGRLAFEVFKGTDARNVSIQIHRSILFEPVLAFHVHPGYPSYGQFTIPGYHVAFGPSPADYDVSKIEPKVHFVVQDFKHRYFYGRSIKN